MNLRDLSDSLEKLLQGFGKPRTSVPQNRVQPVNLRQVADFVTQPFQQQKANAQDLISSQPVNFSNRIIRDVGKSLFTTAKEGIPAMYRISPPGQMQQQIQAAQQGTLQSGAKDRSMQNLNDLFKAGKLGATAYGIPKMTIGSAVGLSGIGGGLSVGVNKAFGSGEKSNLDALREGITGGLTAAPTITGIGRLTNPMITKYANIVGNKFASDGAKQLATRIAAGAMNIPEGAAMNQSLGHKAFDISDALIDFTTGAVLNKPLSARGRVGDQVIDSIKEAMPKGIHPRANKIHNMDAADLTEAMDTLLIKGNPREKRKEAMDTVQRVIDAYAPGYKNASQNKMIEVSEWLLNQHRKQQQNFDIPKMGLVDDAKNVSQERLTDIGYHHTDVDIKDPFLKAGSPSPQNYFGEGVYVANQEGLYPGKNTYKVPIPQNLKTLDLTKPGADEKFLNQVSRELGVPVEPTGMGVFEDLREMAMRSSDEAVRKAVDKITGGYEAIKSPLEYEGQYEMVIRRPRVDLNVPQQPIGGERLTDIARRHKSFDDFVSDPEVVKQLGIYTDETGKPLRVYHGSPESFTEFKTGRELGKVGMQPGSENAISFTPDRRIAEQFASRKPQELLKQEEVVTRKYDDLLRKSQNTFIEKNKTSLKQVLERLGYPTNRMTPDAITEVVRNEGKRNLKGLPFFEDYLKLGDGIQPQYQKELSGLAQKYIGKGNVYEAYLKINKPARYTGEEFGYGAGRESTLAGIGSDYDSVIVRGSDTGMGLGDEYFVGNNSQIVTRQQLEDIYNKANVAQQQIGDKIKISDDLRRELNQDAGKVSDDIPGVSNFSSSNPQSPIKLKDEAKITIGSVADTNKNTMRTKGSVLDDIYSGFDSGRKNYNKERRGDMSQTARTQFVDRLTPVFDMFREQARDLPAETNPYKRMRLLAGASGKAEAILEEGLSPILKRERSRRNDLSALLTLERESELLGRGFKRTRTPEQVQQGIAELKAKHGEQGYQTLRQSANEVRQFAGQFLDELKDAGIISTESYRAIRKNNQFYVPFEAVEYMADNLEKGGFSAGSFNVASQDVIKAIGDSDKTVADPLETLVKRVPKIIALAEKNKAIKSLVDMAEKNEAMGQLITPLKGDPQKGFGIVNVFINGENKRYQVPEEVADAIKNVDAESANLLVKMLSPQAKLLRAGATGFSIGFIPTNIVRDVADSIFTEFTEKGAMAATRFMASYPQAIFTAATKGKLYKEWLKAGGAQSTLTEQIFKNPTKSVDQLSGAISVKNIINPLKLVEFAGNVGEKATRIARYKAGIQAGESSMEAAFKSRDISLDFAKAGNKVKVLNQVIPFLNAGIQGSEKIARLHKNYPAKALAVGTALYTVPATMLYAHNSQFEDFADVPEGEKQTYWLMIARDRTPEERANGDQVVGVKIPKGFIGKLYSNSTESALDFMQKKDPQALATFFADTIESFSPVGLPINTERGLKSLSQVTPPGIQGAAESLLNRNFYFNQPIVSRSLENLPAEYQYKERTPEIYKKIGKATNMSPLKIENFVNTTSGGLGRMGSSLLSGDIKGATVDQVSRRFVGIRDGVKTDEIFKIIDESGKQTALTNKQIKDALSGENPGTLGALTKGKSKQQLQSLFNSVDDATDRKNMSPNQLAISYASQAERDALRESNPELIPDIDAVEQMKANKDIKTMDIGDYFVVNDDGSRKLIEKEVDLTPPIMTGDADIDKKLKSDFKGKITSRKNEIFLLYQNGVIDLQTAGDMMRGLDAVSKSATGGGSGKAKKINLSGAHKVDIKISGGTMPKRLSESRFVQNAPPKIAPFKIRKISDMIKIT